MMSHRGRKSRPLGSVRRSMQGIDNVPRLPQLMSISQSLDRPIGGIHGSAMNVPPPQVSLSPEREEPTPKVKPTLTSGRSVLSSRSAESKSDDSATQEVKKELCEVLSREKQLKAQIAALQKTVDALKVDLTEKEKANEAVKEQVAKLAAQELHYKELYENEVHLHGETQQRLSASEDLMSARDQEISELKLAQQETIKEMNIKMEKRVLEVEKAKNAEIAIREEKLKRLKNQMADALGGNSLERQQQLDELSKELTHAQEEANMLRVKLKAMVKNSTKPGVSGCANCESLSSRIQNLDRSINEKDKVIRELRGLGDKFEKQLNQKEITQKLKNDRKA